jgi:hypothetical protein
MFVFRTLSSVPLNNPKKFSFQVVRKLEQSLCFANPTSQGMEAKNSQHPTSVGNFCSRTSRICQTDLSLEATSCRHSKFSGRSLRTNECQFQHYGASARFVGNGLYGERLTGWPMRCRSGHPGDENLRREGGYSMC